MASSLLVGFVIGAAATVALLFCLKRVAQAANINVFTGAAQGKTTKAPSEPDGTPQQETPDQYQDQWDALMAYDGTKQKRKDEDVTADGN